jgi:3-methyladenine DNA glycosylase AlkD
LEPQSDAVQAAGAEAYMKHIAPFLGMSSPTRRQLQRDAWHDLTPPTSDELGQAAVKLFAQREREYHYAACDLIEKFRKVADEYFLSEYVEELLTTKSWWDTVDNLVNAAVSPLCRTYDASAIIDEWSASDNIWLIRAAIGHQRGWKRETDVARVLSICDVHWTNREFFVAKAIGWALRDLTKIDAPAVRRFLKQHPTPNTVSVREAQRGLQRLS